MGEDVNGTRRTNLELVRHHVPQALVVDHTKENVCLKLTSINTTVETLIAKVVVASWKVCVCGCVGECVCVCAICMTYTPLTRSRPKWSTAGSFSENLNGVQS